MALTFADTHNMIAFLTDSDVTEGFEQIIDFLNAHRIKYAFMVIITEDSIRQALRLNDVDSVDYLPNEEIFAELARMGYEKPFKNLVRNVDSPSKFYMYPRFLQLMCNAQIADLSSQNTMYTSPALTQKVFANMRMVGKGFSGADTPLFAGMLVPQQAQDVEDVAEDEDDVNEVSDEPTSPSPTPATLPPSPQQEHITSQPQAATAPLSPPPQQQPSYDAKISKTLLTTLLETCATLTKQVANLEQDKIAQAIEITKLKQRVKHEDVILEEVDAKIIKDVDVQGRLEESQAKTKVATTATTTITAASVPKASAPRKRGVIIQDPEEAAIASLKHDKAFARELKPELNANINWNEVIEQVKRKERQDNTVMRYQALKRKPVTEVQARKNMMVYLKNMAGFKMDFFKGEMETGEEESKRKSKNPEQKAAKKQKIDEEVSVVDYQIHHEHNKPFYKIIKVDGTHQKDQRGIYGLAKVKSWKLFKSCRVRIITFTTTQMILLVERQYPLTRFTLEQMLNNMRLDVKEERDVIRVAKVDEKTTARRI
nr:hypothetical protein [Tanacetum cinerariifolium]